MPEPRIIREARKLLRDSGLPHELVDGTRHVQVLIAGRRVLVLPHGSGQGKDLHKLRSAIHHAKP